MWAGCVLVNASHRHSCLGRCQPKTAAPRAHFLFRRFSSLLQAPGGRDPKSAGAERRDTRSMNKVKTLSSTCLAAAPLRLPEDVLQQALNDGCPDMNHSGTYDQRLRGEVQVTEV